MSDNESVQVQEGPPLETANDRFKKSFDTWFWGSVLAATVVHFVMFMFWPSMTAEDVSFDSEELVAIELPPEIEIPPPPQAISRPATPVIAAADISEDITIAPTTFEDNPVEELPPPPDEEAVDISAAPSFTPYTVRPDLMNQPEVERALEREYPPILRDNGIGGRVTVHLLHRRGRNRAEHPRRRDLGTLLPRRGGVARGQRVPVQPGAQPGQGGSGVDRASHHVPDAVVGSDGRAGSSCRRRPGQDSGSPTEDWVPRCEGLRSSVAPPAFVPPSRPLDPNQNPIIGPITATT